MSDAAKILSSADSSAVGILAGFLLIPLTALCGLVVEGISDLSIRELIQAGAKNRVIASAFGQGSMHRSLMKWRDLFEDLLWQSPSYHPPGVRDESQGLSLWAAGVFYQHARDNRLDWLLSHYATYYLASSYGLVVFLFAIVGIVKMCAGHWSTPVGIAVAVGSLLSTYSMWSLSMDRYLYTYVATYRYAALWLMEVKEKEVSHLEAMIHPE